MFVGAIGDEKEVKPIQIGFCFQVTDVRKPLLAVKRISEKGNLVQFGPEDKDNFIQNKRTGDRVELRPKGGSYILDAQLKDGRWTEITVDSAAEESVCPSQWAQDYGIKQEGHKLNLVNASGGKIQHYGSRDVVVKANSTF